MLDGSEIMDVGAQHRADEKPVQRPGQLEAAAINERGTAVAQRNAANGRNILRRAGVDAAKNGAVAAAVNVSERVGLFPNDVIRRAADPAGALLEFCESTYAAGARLAGWDRELLERRPSARHVA